MSSDSVVFDRAVGYYDETRGFPPGEDKPVAALIAAAGQLTSSSRILEVGIGTGRISLPLSAHVGKIYGVDLSVLMMGRLLSKRRAEPIMLAQADVTRLPFRSGAFDAVVASHIFHLVPHWKDGLSEAARVLRPGGVLLNCWHRGDASRFDVLMQAWNTAVPEQDTVARRAFRWEENGSYPEQVGWKPDGSPHKHSFQTQRTPQRYLEQRRQRIWSGMWSLNDEQMARGMAALEAAIKAHFDDPNEVISITDNFYVQTFTPPM